MDEIARDFFEAQQRDGLELARGSDRLDLEVITPQRYLAHYRCRGLVATPGGRDVHEADEFVVGLRFDDDYLRRVEPAGVVQLLNPRGIWHPNALGPLLCLGRVSPGTPLVELLFRVYELLTHQSYTPREDDALNPAACAWSRRNAHRLPVDDRPLKRRGTQVRWPDEVPA